jgi:hypothetical protein
LLSSWAIAHQAINVEADPSALLELQRLKISTVPALVQGDRAFHGWNPEELARFLGVEYAPATPLPPEKLALLLSRILEATQRAILQVPREKLSVTVPGRDRSVRDLGYHLFRLSLAYRDALETQSYPEAWLQETPPANFSDGAAIADYGRRVRDRLDDWWLRPNACKGVVNTYYGTQTAHELLERTVWHAAQHLRQLYALLEQMGEVPQDPLTAADFQGLPLPRELW